MQALVPHENLIGKYRVVRLVAHGGTSSIYEAVPLQGAGRVAIKQLASTPESSEFKEDYRLFQGEFERLSHLSHSGLPRALDFFEDNGRHYFVEEFIEGPTLQEEIERLGQISWQRAIEIMLSILDVLAYLHQNKIIYRDLKPRNVILGRDGCVRVVDLGAARVWKRGAKKDTIELGTPGYASPEHYGGAQTDERSDVYTAGVVLRHMLSGCDPQNAPAWQLEPLPQELPPSLQRAVDRATAMAPADRLCSVERLHAELACLVPGHPVTLTATAPAPPAPAGPRPRTLHYPFRNQYGPVFTPFEYAAWCVGYACIFGSALLASRNLLILLFFVIAFIIRGLLAGYLYLAWRRHSDRRVDVLYDGLRFWFGGMCLDVLWTEIQSLRLSPVYSLVIISSKRAIEIPFGWPATKELTEAIVQGAQLTRRVVPNEPDAIYTR